jgi:T-complex protein 1 subunit delta
MRIQFQSETGFTTEERQILVESTKSSLSSKLASQWSDILAPLAVDCILRVSDGKNVDLRNDRVVGRVGRVLDDSALINGIIFPHHFQRSTGESRSIENAKIALIQFQLRPSRLIWSRRSSSPTTPRWTASARAT